MFSPKDYIPTAVKKTLRALLLLAISSAGLAGPAFGAATRQTLVVTSPRGTTPVLEAVRGLRRFYGPWPVEIGWGGLIPAAARREGDGATPEGTFGIGRTVYGVGPRPAGLHLRYHRLVCGDWWDEDPYSLEYNRFVHVPCGSRPPFGGDSEALWRERVAYRLFAVVDFNTRPIIRGAAAPGSAIFLHAWVGGPTDGCVALRFPELLRVLRWLRASGRPQIRIAA